MMQSLNKTRVCVSLEEFRLACQCPICQETFQEPVTLTCENCFKNLPIVDRLRFQCASCRKVYKASVKEDLKPAIDLQHVTEIYRKTEAESVFMCNACKNKFRARESWYCTDCSFVICSTCVVRYHKIHNQIEIAVIVTEIKGQLEIFRTRCKVIEREHVKWVDDICENWKLFIKNPTDKMLYKILPEPMEDKINKFRNEIKKFVEKLDSMDANKLAEEYGNVADIFRRFENVLSSLNENQELLRKKETEMVSLTKKYNDDLINIWSAIAVDNSSNESESI